MIRVLVNKCDSYFAVSARGSTFIREIRGGIVTFFAVAYIIVLNPIILGGKADRAGYVLPMHSVAAATACATGVMTILFGIIARYPFAIAAGLGVNNLLAVSVINCTTWPEAMGLVVIGGIVIVLLVISGVRTAVFNAIPAQLKAAISVGIGCFVAFIGCVDAGFVKRIPDAARTIVPVGLGDNNSLASLPTLIFLCGVVLMGVLTARQVNGSFLIGIAVSAALAIIVQNFVPRGSIVTDQHGWSATIPHLPHSIARFPDLSLIGQVDIVGACVQLGFLSSVVIIFTVVVSNFFDAMGTISGLAHEAALVDNQGNIPGITKALLMEGCSAIAGGITSTSSNTVFVESAAGIAEGARTGVASIVTGILFLAAMFITPLYAIIPSEAIAPVLIIVGALMIRHIRTIDFR